MRKPNSTTKKPTKYLLEPAFYPECSTESEKNQSFAGWILDSLLACDYQVSLGCCVLHHGYSIPLFPSCLHCHIDSGDCSWQTTERIM